MKSVLISIKPHWCALISSGRKTLEIRKTAPKLETPFKCYIYCTKGKENDPHELLEIHDSMGRIHRANGKVIGEFICEDCSLLCKHHLSYIEKHAMITKDELYAYLGVSGQQDLTYEAMGCYGWAISDLEIYDTPLELSQFSYPPETYCEKSLCGRCPLDQVADVNGEYAFDCEWKRPVLSPPRSWCYVDGFAMKQQNSTLQEGELF